jgi:hypothetical protein
MKHAYVVILRQNIGKVGVEVIGAMYKDMDDAVKHASQLPSNCGAMVREMYVDAKESVM